MDIVKFRELYYDINEMVPRSGREKPLSFRLKSFLSASSEGFTLVEMAMVLVAVGIVIALGASLIGPLTKRVKFNDSRDIVNGAVDSVSSWAAGKNRVPCAKGDQTAGTACASLSLTTDEFSAAVRNPNDAFGRPLIYIYDSALTIPSTTNSPKDTICGRQSTNINVNNSISNVAFIILSGGDDYRVDTKIGTTPVSSGTITAATTVTADIVNDIVKWVTLDELRTKIGCQGSQLKVVDNELPYGYNGAPYSANVYADGGVPYTNYVTSGKYKWCIEDSVAWASPTIGPVSMTFNSDKSGTAIPFYATGNCSGNPLSWIQGDSITIAGTPWIVLAETSDSPTNLYICIKSHISGPANQPSGGAGITGTPATFWQFVNNTSMTGWQPWATGSFYLSGTNTLTFFAMDSNGNVAQKNLTLTINPQ